MRNPSFNADGSNAASIRRLRVKGMDVLVVRQGLDARVTLRGHRVGLSFVTATFSWYRVRQRWIPTRASGRTLLGLPVRAAVLRDLQDRLERHQHLLLPLTT